MASRFQRDSSRNALFSNYDSQSRSRPASAANSASPGSRHAAFSTYQSNSSPYSYSGQQHNSSGNLSTLPPAGAGFSAYPSDANGARRSGDGGFRPATPNKKGQYSDAVIDELESQNDDQVGEMTKKVRMLKDLSLAIGGEIKDSTAFMEKMNDSFEGTRNRLRGTMNRMLLMAERTGVGWRIWLGFFVFIFLLFAYVWLF